MDPMLAYKVEVPGMRIMYEAKQSTRLGILCVGLLLTASSVQAQREDFMGPRYNAQNVQVHLETRHSTFKVGDSITVRITMHNITNQAFSSPAAPTSLIVGLHVLDSKGRSVKVTRSSRTKPAELSGLAPLQAGQEI